MNYTYYRRYQKPRRRKRSQFSSFFWLVVILVILILILKACASIIGAFSNEKRDDLTLSVEKGGGEILSFGQSEWESAPDLGVILEGDSVQSDTDSYLLLTVHDGPTLRMDEDTYISFDHVEFTEEGETVIHLMLNDGRVWYESEEDQLTRVVIHTDVMDVSGGETFLLSNQANNESLYVFGGQVNVDYIDRGLNDVVLESLSIRENFKSLITSDLESALLAREAVTLVEPMEENELSENDFVQWSVGENRVIQIEESSDEDLEESSDETREEENSEEAPTEAEEEVKVTEEALTIQITSPASGSSDEDGAIAIEGVVTSGTAASIYVTWSGNGQPYQLGLFEPDSGSFRYVADVQYSNFAAGSNTYSITAYDVDGNPSNTVSVDISGDF